jgi:hypothetical protein
MNIKNAFRPKYIHNRENIPSAISNSAVSPFALPARRFGVQSGLLKITRLNSKPVNSRAFLRPAYGTAVAAREGGYFAK